MTTQIFRIGDCDFGRGLFAVRPILDGQTILTFTGPEISLGDVRAKGLAAANALQIGINRYLDLEEPGRLVNHSCAPNALVRDDRQLVAWGAISIGQEIRFDYSTTIGDGWTMPCRCGAECCRGLVVAFYLLPPHLQRKYAVLRGVQGFLQDGLGA